MSMTRRMNRTGLGMVLAGAGAWTLGLGGCGQTAITLPKDPAAPLMLSKFPERWNPVYRAADDLKTAAAVVRSQLTACGMKLDDPMFVAAMRRLAEAIAATEARSPSPAKVQATTLAALDAVLAAKAKCPSDLPPDDPFAKCLLQWQETLRSCANDLTCLHMATIAFLQCMGVWTPPTGTGSGTSSGNTQGGGTTVTPTTGATTGGTLGGKTGGKPTRSP